MGIAALLLALWAAGVHTVFESPRLAVEVEMASSVPGYVQLFADDGGGFRQALSDRAAVAGDGRFATVRLGLVPGGPIRALRLDPLNAPGRLRVRAVTVSHRGRSTRFAGADLARWSPVNQLESEEGADELRLLALGTDPRLTLDGQWLPTSLWHRPDGRELAIVALAVPFLLLTLGPAGGRWRPALALATPAGLIAVLNYPALSSWWIHDDPCLLASALKHGIAPHFFDPEVWRGLSGTVLMPWTILSFGADARIFGLEPAAFYAHQLVSLAFLLVAAYLLFRRSASLSAAAASLALALFAASAPAFAVAERLMNRHYLEGLILFLGALALYMRSAATGRLGFAAAGAGLYLLAATAKEVFVPLIAVLPFLSAAGWRARLRSALPFAAAALLYLPWRLFMLGWTNSLSGYAPQPDGRERFGFASAATMVGLERPWQVVVAALVLGGALAVAVRHFPGRLPLFLVAALAVGLPLLPVAEMLGPRHFLMPALAAAFLVGRWVEPWLASRPAFGAAAGLALLLFALHALTASPVWRGQRDTVARHRAEGEFVLASDEEGVLLTGLADPSYLKCVAEIRHDVVGRPGGPRFCGDVCWCRDARAGSTFWQEEGGRIAAVEPPRQACAEDRPLSVEMSYDRRSGRLGWRLGPHRADRGSYQVLLVTGEGPPDVSTPVPIAASGEAPLALREEFRWIVKYRSSEGWQTYSPILTLDPEIGRLGWERETATR